MSLPTPEPIPDEIEEIGYRVIGCAITVHRILGPGFKELIYARALCLELDEAGLSYECEKRILVPYKGRQIEGHRVDLIIGGVVIAELKVFPPHRRDPSVASALVLESHGTATRVRDELQLRGNEAGDKKGSPLTSCLRVFVPL